MTKSRSAYLAAFALLATATPLRADFLNLGTQCYVGAFHACASISISALPVANLNGGGPGTVLVIQVSNLMGTAGYNYSGAQGIGSLTVGNLQVTGTPFTPGVTRATATGTTGTLQHAMYWLNGNSIFLEPENGLHSPIFGCSQPPQYSQGPYAGTGPNYTCNGTMIYTLDFYGGGIGLDAQTNIGFNWMNFDDNGAQLGSADCVTDSTCMTNVPEPVTMVLLGTGLAAVGGLRARRRRESDGAADPPA